MSDLDLLRELRAQVRPPAYDELVAAAKRRRRRSVLTSAAGAALLVLGVSVTGAALSGHDVALVPAQDPAPNRPPEPSADGPWTPERVRAEGSPTGPMFHRTQPGPNATEYSVCRGAPPCDFLRRVLEVTQDGRSALFEVRGRLPDPGSPQWVQPFDDDSVLVRDAENMLGEGPTRYRLLQADGTEVTLQPLDPAPAVPGPGLVSFEGSFEGRQGLMRGDWQDLHLVDAGAGTIRPLDVPDDEIYHWAPNIDEALWGVGPDCRVFWVTGGQVQQRRLPCESGGALTGLVDIFPPVWLQPGRMAAVEWIRKPSDRQMAVHVSLDNGRTWQRIHLGPLDPDHWHDQVHDALRDLR